MNRLQIAAFLLAVSRVCAGPDARPTRTYPFSEEVLKTALERLGAFEDGSLPMFEGFVALETARLKGYDRPHFQFHAEFHPSGPGRTAVSLQARISARYRNPDGVRLEYRELPSSGRLEADLLDRLDQYLAGNLAPDGPDLAAMRERASALRNEADSAELERARLANEVRKLESMVGQVASPARLAAVKAASALVLDRPSDSARVLLRAGLDDEFAVLAQHGAWVEVRIGASASGWLRLSRLELPAGMATRPAGRVALRQEQTGTFTGQWPPLHGKPAVFVWVEPALQGAARPAAPWSDAKRVFADSYRTISHLPHSTAPAVEGVVVIFKGPAAAVAAATLTDIRQWLEGAISDAIFMKRCSLDSREAFEAPGPDPPARQHPSGE